MGKRVLLINPPSPHRLLLPMDAKKSSNAGCKPPLGILYLGTCLRQRTSADVHLFDGQVLNTSIEDVIKFARRLNPDLVGITTWTDYWYDICLLIDEIKGVLPDTHICLGGPHTGIFPRESLRRKSVDSIIIGDGEAPLVHLIAVMEEKADRSFPGLYFSDEEEAIGHFHPYVEKDLDAIPIPDRTLLAYNRYDSLLANGPMTTMVTGRGCLFRCTFCRLDFQKTVLRSPQGVIAEMDEIAQLGIKEIEIYDDTFGIDRDRVLEICRRMKQRGFTFKLTLRDRVNNIDDEVVAALKEAGLVRIFLGIESASDKTLQRVKKGITVEQARHAVRVIKSHCIEVLAYFMLGLPGETREDFERSLQFAMELEPDYVNFSLTIPYPGTELYKLAMENGVIDHDIWREFVEDPIKNMVMPVYEERHTRDELLRVHQEIIRKFYFRKEYIFNRLLKIRSFSQFIKNAKEAFALWRD
ncbi:MAG: radical SAM protein [Candidatus Tectomicrobia bacterium]|nr:radical SAM protein [Candidatus Tectomicrobia bacterium]